MGHCVSSSFFRALSPMAAALLILSVVSWNRGKGRIVDQRLKVHRSVKTRIEALGEDEKDEGYLPVIRCVIEGEKEPRCLRKAEWLADEPQHFKWVD